MYKKFHQLSTEEKINSNIFFKLGFLISKEVGTCSNYSVLDNYYKYQNNVFSEKKNNGRVYTSYILLNPAFALKIGFPEKIEIKTGSITMERDVFYKEERTGITHLTQPYQIMEGEGKNFDAHSKLLAGFFTGQTENK